MRDSTNGELVAFAKTLTHNGNLTEYFEERFFSASNRATKEAIERKLDSLLGVGAFSDLTCGKSTMDLARAIDEKKVVLFDLGRGSIGSDEGRAFGRLVIAMLLGIAFRREKLPISQRIPCSLIVDECQQFATESMGEILRETRKYRLMLTLSQQIIGQNMGVSLTDTVLQTTNMKFVGGTPDKAARNAALLGLEEEDVRTLQRGEFFVRPQRTGPLVKFRTRTNLLKDQNSVSKLTWRRTIKDQVDSYYRSKIRQREDIDRFAAEDVDQVDTSSKEWL